MKTTYADARRQTAAEELGGTRVRRGAAACLALLFAATVVSVSVVQHAAELRQPERNGERGGAAPPHRTWPQPYDIFRTLPAWSEVRAARRPRDFLALLPTVQEIHQYEDALEDASVVSRWTLPRVQYVLTWAVRAGNEQAYPGRGSWLFYRPDVDYVTGPPFLEGRVLARRAVSGEAWESPPQPDPVRAIVDFHRALAERGVALVVLPTPVKPMAYPDRLARRYVPRDAPLQNPSYTAFVRALRERGVLVFDAATALRETRDGAGPRYLRTDTHWTPQTATRTAELVADYVRANVTLPSRPTAAYVVRSEEIAAVGDIAAMLKLPPGQRLFPPETVTVRPVYTSAGERWSPSADADVLLLGDSFSNIYSLAAMGWGSSAGFVEHLSAALGRPLDKIVLNAGGAHATREHLAQEIARGVDRLAGKRLVIYQFAVRELTSGDWRLYDLAPASRTGAPPAGAAEATPPPAAAAPPSAGEGIVVEGVVKERAEPPAPGSTPYPECVIAVWLGAVRAVPRGAGAERATPIGDEAVVFVWGMRDNVWADAARLRPGDAVRLRLRPWAEVEAEYGSYSRRELESEAAWLLDTYWGEFERPEP
jgi:alginate O-acetyltransferase complex protein AlgJ